MQMQLMQTWGWSAQQRLELTRRAKKYATRSYLEQEINLSLKEQQLSLVCHTTSSNPLKLSAHTPFLNLALFLFLRVFKVTSVAKFHHVARLVDFTLESTKCTLDRFTITHINLDFDSQ
jgi:hypothetical protein